MYIYQYDLSDLDEFVDGMKQTYMSIKSVERHSSSKHVIVERHC